jgi:WD40 repeat protein
MSPRERWLATGGADATVHVWDWSRALCTASESARWATLSAHRLGVTGVQWTSETKLLSISTDGTCRVWDVLARHVLFAVTFSTPLTALAASPTGHCAYLGGEDGVIYRLGLYDPPARDFQIETARDDKCYRGHKQRVTSLATSIDGSHVISTSADHTCLVWYENSFQIAHSFTRHMGAVVHAAVVLKLDAREEEQRGKKRAGLKMLSKISKDENDATQVTRRVMSLSDTKHELIDTLWHQDTTALLVSTDVDHEPVAWSEDLFHARTVRRPSSAAVSALATRRH